MAGTERSEASTWVPDLAKRLLLVFAMAGAALLLWRLAEVALLLFAAILLSLLLRAVAEPIERWTRLPCRWSVALSCVLILALLSGFVWLLGSEVRTQSAALFGRLPNLVSSAEAWLGVEGLVDRLGQFATSLLLSGGIASGMAGYTAWLAGIAGMVLVVVSAAVYLALSPGLYHGGLLKVIPEGRQAAARETLHALARALRLWLAGQLVAMTLIGTLTALGLWALGIPSALALGILAGLLEFVPYAGPILAALPALALGLADSPSTALWVGLFYLALQQVEGNLVTPLVQQRAVALPPVVTIFALIAFGLLFGPLGLLLATPLAVVCLVLVKKLWIRDVLEEEVTIPGEPAPPDGLEPPTF